ncbi:MAG: NUDIX domain-containing protein [Patescibacteria group bacterium]
MKKRILKFLNIVVYPFFRFYWFIFRPKTHGVKIVLTYGRKILFIRHSYRKGWGFPGGGIRPQENKENAIKREVKEEIGIGITELMYLGFFESNIEYKKDTVHIFTTPLSTERVFIDNIEIEEARWFPLDALPPLGSRSKKVISMYESQFKKN